MTDPHDTHTKEQFEQELVSHDEWFRHSTNEPHHMAAHGETKALAILIFLLVTVIFVFGTGYLVLIFFDAQARVLRTTVEEANTPREEYLGRVQQWEAEQTTFGWADAEAGAVRVPIEVAIDRVLEDYKANPGDGS